MWQNAPREINNSESKGSLPYSQQPAIFAYPKHCIPIMFWG